MKTDIDCYIRIYASNKMFAFLCILHPLTQSHNDTCSYTQDLIKYTPPHHADRVTLQLALARCETIAEHLNEAKRAKEQQIIVAHLSSRVTGLPFRLTDSPNRCLQTQEPVTRLVRLTKATPFFCNCSIYLWVMGYLWLLYILPGYSIYKYTYLG